VNWTKYRRVDVTVYCYIGPWKWRKQHTPSQDQVTGLSQSPQGLTVLFLCWGPGFVWISPANFNTKLSMQLKWQLFLSDFDRICFFKLLVHVRVYIYVGDKLGLHITVVSHLVLVYLNIVVIRIMMIGISLIFMVVYAAI
jgi:hypothetical protein